MMDLDEFNQKYFKTALAQGWMLCEVDFHGKTEVEVQRVDDALAVGMIHNVQVPSLLDDYQAVCELRAAFMRGEDHALMAYALVKSLSAQEFTHWDMQSWSP